MTLRPLWRGKSLRSLDERALEDLPWLMEVAGSALADAILRELERRQFGSDARVELWIGPGNNGGDGLVAFRHLEEIGLAPRVWAPLGLPSSGDAADALKQLADSGVVVDPLDSAFESDPDLIVDCLFGTGLSRPLSGSIADAVERHARLGIPLIACDVPSGLCADTGRVLGVALRAERTITFGGLKVGFYCSDGLDFCGEIQLATLGYRRDHYHTAESAAWLDLRQARQFLPPSRRADHKGRYGRVMALSGSPGLEGAALLTMLGARCGGAGLLHLWSPELKRGDFDDLPAEVMLAPFAEHALDAAQRSDVIIAGPGMGRSQTARQQLLRLVEAASDKPWVLDADALYHLAEEPFDLPETCVLTPHEGEALRLLGEDPLTGTWGGDRLALVEAIGARFNCLVLLKGAGNLLRVCESTYLVPGSARSLARGGSGDILSGLIAALAGRGATLEQAVHLAVRLQLSAAQRFDAGHAETVTQQEIAQAITESWQGLYAT